MLRLDNIQVKLDRPFFKPRHRKFLRISSGSVLKITSTMASINNQRAISWNQSISLPYTQGQQYLFEVFQKHQFGYNPQELQTILKGTILFDNPKEINGRWNIFTSNQQKIGVLQAIISAKVSKVAKNMKENTNISLEFLAQNNGNKAWKITSMVATTTDYDLKKAWISVQVGERKLKTIQVKSKAGEFIYTQAKQMELEAENSYASIKIYNDKSLEQQYLIGQAILLLNCPKPQKKAYFMKNGEEVGELYIQSRIADKKSKAKVSRQRKLAKFNQFLTIQTAAPKQENQSRYQTINQPPSQSMLQANYKKNQAYRSIDTSRIEHNAIATSRLSRISNTDISMMSTNRQKNRHSVVNRNSNIIIPKQRRFALYEDHKNNRISYLKERSFQFKSPRTGRSYRGASFGYGDKTDFTKQRRQSPGVGNYKLPSIWDKY